MVHVQHIVYTKIKRIALHGSLYIFLLPNNSLFDLLISTTKKSSMIKEVIANGVRKEIILETKIYERVHVS